jgi:CHAD domain-containing protein
VRKKTAGIPKGAKAAKAAKAAKVAKTPKEEPPGLRELVLTYIGAQVGELRERELGARIESPDAVHRMRVASRRLRSTLATFGPLFAGSQVKDLRAELRWLGTMLGPVRDVEVMRAHLQATVTTLPAQGDPAEALAGLGRELAGRHAEAQENLIQALDSPRYALLLDAFATFVTEPPWADPAHSEDRQQRHTLEALVARACARVDRAADAADAAQTVKANAGGFDVAGPELHEVRKTAKRARYAAEVAIPSAGSPARLLARRMEELQEVLGRHQDSLMARGVLQDLAGRMPENQAFALGLLTGVERAGDESVLAEYQLALAAASSDEVRGWANLW